MLQGTQCQPAVSPPAGLAVQCGLTLAMQRITWSAILHKLGPVTSRQGMSSVLRVSPAPTVFRGHFFSFPQGTGTDGNLVARSPHSSQSQTTDFD